MPLGRKARMSRRTSPATQVVVYSTTYDSSPFESTVSARTVASRPPPTGVTAVVFEVVVLWGLPLGSTLR